MSLLWQGPPLTASGISIFPSVLRRVTLVGEGASAMGYLLKERRERGISHGVSVEGEKGLSPGKHGNCEKQREGRAARMHAHRRPGRAFPGWPFVNVQGYACNSLNILLSGCVKPIDRRAGHFRDPPWQMLKDLPLGILKDSPLENR